MAMPATAHGQRALAALLGYTGAANGATVLAMCLRWILLKELNAGAAGKIRTFDPTLTKGVLYP